MKTIAYYLKKISVLFENNFLARMAFGVLIGVITGVLLFLGLQKDISDSVILIASAFAGVFAEILVDVAQKSLQTINQLKPLNRVLGTISTDDSWIYISAWRRDLDDRDHSKLYRNDPRRSNQPIIVGSEYVYGKGDAIALSYVYQAIEKASSGKTRISVEDSEQMLDYWGRSVICIGAHNSKTREILDKFHNTFFRFELNYTIIVDTSNPPTQNKTGIKFVQGVSRAKGRDSSNID